MALKPDAKDWTIKEQIIEDLPTGITLQFEVASDGTFRLKLYGDFPYGNRDIVFNQSGEKVGSGTSVSGLCRPAWLTKIDEGDEDL